MCFPMLAAGAAAGTAATSTAAIATALQVASLAATVGSAAMSYSAQRQQAKAQQAAARYNQQAAEIQAEDALDRGAREQEAAGRKISQLRGQQRANMAANGLDLSYADQTPAAILEQTDYYGLEDQRTIANNANREATNFKNRANLYGMQATDSGSNLASFGSLLTGAGQVADKWYSYRR
jgi:hypothetical protein